MPPLVRRLIVENESPKDFSANDLLRALGLPVLDQPRGEYPGLRSLALLKLMPKPEGSAGSDADVAHVQQALSQQSCEALRAAVDRASFSAADSVDGCIDYQLNLDREALEQLIGTAEVDRLWEIALQRAAACAGVEGAVRRDDYGSTAGGDDSDAGLGLDCATHSGSEEEGQRRRAIAKALEAHEIFVRRYSPSTRPWFPFHKDRSALTVNVALSDDVQHGGGRLICVYGGLVHRLERSQGCATVHPSTLMHAVSRMTHGSRYALIIFLGRNENIVRFNREVQRVLKLAATA